MTETAIVGFSPAAVPSLSPGASVVSAKPAADGGLFAALLALLAPGTAGTNLIDITLPDAIASPVQQGLAKAKDLLPQDLDAQFAATAGKLGIDLTSLGDLLAGFDAAAKNPVDPEAVAEAVTSLVEALAAMTGAPSDAEGSEIARHGELEATADALLVLIGAPPPAPPPAPTTGETFTQLVGELTEALTGPGKPSSDALTPPLPAVTGGDKATDASAPISATRPASATAPISDPAIEPATDGTRPPLVERLTQLLDEAAKAVAPANPQLAEKLAALARALPTLPDKVLTALETATSDNADESAPELASLINQIARPRPAQRTATAPAFAAPRLELPTLKTDAGGAPVPELNPAPKAPALNTADLASAPAAPGAARPDAPSAGAIPAQPTPVTAPADTGPDKPVEVIPAPTATAAGQQAPAAAPAALRVVQAAYQPPATPINLPQVAFEFVRQVQAGNSRFQIRLDPAELGRIDVQLDVDRSGNVNARMVVERPETLDLMQRDQRALQQALQQAGLDANRTSLEFSLRQNPFAGEGSADGRNQGQSGRQTGGLLAGDAGTDPVPEIYRGTAAPGALNLFV